jgi:hypothetical protein
VQRAATQPTAERIVDYRNVERECERVVVETLRRFCPAQLFAQSADGWPLGKDGRSDG